jgi:hypothetical protein
MPLAKIDLEKSICIGPMPVALGAHPRFLISLCQSGFITFSPVLLQEQPRCDSLLERRSSIASDQETETLFNKKMTAGCSCNNIDGSVVKPLRHVTAPELTSSMRQGPELRDTWQRQSSPQHRGEVRNHETRDSARAHGGEIQGHETCGSTGAHLNTKARSRAAGHVMTSEPISIGRCDLKLPLI